MTEVPIFNAPELMLTDHEIENPHEYNAERPEKFDLENEDLTPPIWPGSEPTHESVQAPVVVREREEKLSHEQQLVKSIETMTHLGLVKDIAGVTQNVSAARRYTLAA